MKGNKNNSFFKELFASIKDFDKYQDFAVHKVSKEIIYILKLIAIFTFIISLAFTFKMHIEKNKLVKYINENISDVKFENEKLSVNNDEKVILEDVDLVNMAIFIETRQLNEEEIKIYKEKIDDYSNGILLLNDKMIVKTEINNGYTDFLYSDIVKQYDIESFNKQDLLNVLNGKEVIVFYIMFFGIFYFYMFIIYFITIIIYAIMLALLGRITSMLLRIPMQYKATFNMAIHALTLPIILNIIYIIVNLFTGFDIKYFQVMYSTISYIYMVSAILIIKADFIKRGQELSKIIEEQQKIRKEYKENQEDDERSENKDKKEDEKEKSDKENENKQEPEVDNG